MINKHTIVGYVGSTPEIKSFENGGKVAEFSIATDDSYKKKDGTKVDQSDWHKVRVTIPSIVSFIDEHIDKGMLLYIEGKVKTDSWEKDGEKKFMTRTHANTIQVLKWNEERKAGSGHTPPSLGEQEGENDDLPW